MAGQGEIRLTLGRGIAEYPLTGLSSIENVLDTDVTHRPIMGLLLSFRTGNVTSGGEGHVGDPVLALCLIKHIFSSVQRLHSGVCEDGIPRGGAPFFLMDLSRPDFDLELGVLSVPM